MRKDVILNAVTPALRGRAVSISPNKEEISSFLAMTPIVGFRCALSDPQLSFTPYPKNYSTKSKQ